MTISQRILVQEVRRKLDEPGGIERIAKILEDSYVLARRVKQLQELAKDRASVTSEEILAIIAGVGE